MKLLRRKELRNTWGGEVAMTRHYRTIWEGSPVLRRFYKEVWGMAMEDVHDAPMIEIGGGASFIREYHPQILSSDILPFPESNMVCDAADLPLADESVGSLISVASFHHMVNPRHLFEEVQRVLKPAGRYVIIDPYITPLSNIIYGIGTQEECNLKETPFEMQKRDNSNPLLEANTARATVIFKKNPELFEATFPYLSIVEVEYHNFFRHIAAGSPVQRSPWPAWSYPIAAWVDRALHPIRHLTGMLMKVVLEKQ